MKSKVLKYVVGAAILVVPVILALAVPMPASWSSLLTVLGVSVGGYVLLAPLDWFFSFRKFKEEKPEKKVLDIVLIVVTLAALVAALYVIFFSDMISKKRLQWSVGILLGTVILLVMVGFFSSRPRSGLNNRRRL